MRKDDEGTSQVISFAVAGAIFLTAVGAIILSGFGAGRDVSSADAAAQDQQAESLADLLLGSPGIGWALGADGVERLGLADDDGFGLEQSSLDALRGATFEPSDNDRVDYEDALASLGLDPAGDTQFHLRVYPIGTDATYDASASGLRVAYIGDWSSLASVTLPLGTPVDQLPSVANARLNLSMFATTSIERDALDQLGLEFNNRVYVTVGTPTILVDIAWPLPDLPLLTVLNIPFLEGDVYPDHKQYLDAVLAGRLPNYDVLVVGSGVDHSTMTSNVVKDAIRDWVLAGGTLIVLGSSAQGYQWLQPLFQVGIATVNGSPSAPDVAHPLLKEPNVLAWTNYDTHGRGWDISSQGSGAHYDDFSHVVVQGGEDVLAISKDGGFGAGRIILTTYMPREIGQTMGQEEASHFFENMVMYADRSHLYLEYGPTAPPNTSVAVAIRQSWLDDELLGTAPVRVEVQTWS